MALRRDGKLDVTETIAGAWGDMWRLWKPGALLVLCLIAPIIPFIVIAAISLPTTPSTPPAAPSTGTILGMLAGFLVFLTLGSAVYILLMRLFLLGREQFLSISPATLTRYVLRYIWKVIQFVVIALLVMLVIMGPMALVMGFAAGARSAGAPVSGLLIALLILVALAVMAAGILLYVVIMVRFFPVFFSIAVGGNLSFRDAWRGMSGHTWRSFVSLFIVYLAGSAITSGVMIFVVIIAGVAGGVGAAMGVEMTEHGMAGGFASLIWLAMLPGYFVSITWTAATQARIFKDVWPPHDEVALPEEIS